MVDACDTPLPALDAFPLGASRWEVPNPVAVVLVAPATGVRRRLYRDFAGALAAHRLAVLTWDWRGTGDSRPSSLRGFAATMRQWAELDLGGAIVWARRRHPNARLAVVGHSFGGQALGLVPDPVVFDRAVTVAAQSGYWGHWPRPRRYLYAMLWTLVVPALCKTLGYFPSSRLGLGEDLPAGVALQWARWCRRPDYLGDYSGHGLLRAPLLAFGFTDDPYAPPAAVDALHRHYSAARVVRRRVSPRDAGVDHLGHFGFFRLGAGHPLWRQAADWLSGGED